MKRILLCALCAAILFALAGCDMFSSLTGRKKDNVDNDIASSYESNDLPETVTGTIVFKDFGTVKFELYPKKATQSVLNFIYLAKSEFYNGIVVHRLVNDFVIQAGAYESSYVERKTDSPYTITGEFSENGFENPIKHEKGTLSWARPADYNGASTQFFICTQSNANVSYLDGKYAAFGKVTEGFDVIDEINAQPTSNDVPKEEILIESVTIDSDFDFPEPNFIT